MRPVVGFLAIDLRRSKQRSRWRAVPSSGDTGAHLAQMPAHLLLGVAGGGGTGPQESLKVPDSVQIVQRKPTDHCVHTWACPATVPRAANAGLRGQVHDDGRSLTITSWGQVEQVERDS